MEKEGIFSTIKQEVVGGLSPTKPTSKDRDEEVPVSPTIDLPHPRRRKGRRLKNHPFSHLPEPFMARRGTRFRPLGQTLAPLMEEPPYAGAGTFTGDSQKNVWSKWVRSVSTSYAAAGCSGSTGSTIRSDLRLLLGVMGAPLAPAYVNSSVDNLPHISIKDTPIESSAAQYILQQYTAATGGFRLQSSIRSACAIGKLRMMMKNRTAAPAETGGFVLWQMAPDKWYVELAVCGNKIRAGSDGKLVWRHTPWLKPHAAKGPVRPLRRALQGIDPLTTASLFINALCIGEKKVNGEDCFILRISADPETLRARSDGAGEIIRHALFGYFSQKSGLLIHMEDSHLTRIQSSAGAGAVYWETTINSFIDDYRPVEGVMIAHSGRSIVTLFRFGETAMRNNSTTMEESWTIEEVAFNVPGISSDCFIAPADIRCRSKSAKSTS